MATETVEAENLLSVEDGAIGITDKLNEDQIHSPYIKSTIETGSKKDIKPANEKVFYKVHQWTNLLTQTFLSFLKRFYQVQNFSHISQFNGLWQQLADEFNAQNRTTFTAKELSKKFLNMKRSFIIIKGQKDRGEYGGDWKFFQSMEELHKVVQFDLNMNSRIGRPTRQSSTKDESQKSPHSQPSPKIPHYKLRKNPKQSVKKRKYSTQNISDEDETHKSENELHPSQNENSNDDISPPQTHIHDHDHDKRSSSDPPSWFLAMFYEHEEHAARRHEERLREMRKHRKIEEKKNNVM